MKQFTVFIEGSHYTPEKLVRVSKFFSEVLKTKGSEAGDIRMSFKFREEDQSEILQLADTYGIADLTNMQIR